MNFYSTCTASAHADSVFHVPQMLLPQKLLQFYLRLGWPGFSSDLFTSGALHLCLRFFGETGRGFSAGAHIGTIPARSLFRAVHSDSISNLLGRMWNPQRLAPILRRDVSRVEPAKARDQRSRDRGDRSPLA